MANIKISQLPAASVVTAGSDVLPMVHAGVTQKVTPDLLVQTVLGAPGPIGDDVAGSAAFTTLTASGAVTLNPADANVALSPTGSGAVNIQPNGGLLVNPASVGSMNNVAIGGATPQPGTFTALTSTGTTTLNGTTIPSGVILVDTTTAQAVANKTLYDAKFPDAELNNFYSIKGSSLAGNYDATLPTLTSNDTFVFANATQTLTNKTISGATNTITNIGNAALTNSSITIGSSPVSLGGTLSSVSGLSINSSAIGASTPSTGAFTTLSASSTVSGTGFSTYLASPPAIGGTTPAAGNFTTLGSTGDTTLGDAAGDTLMINGTVVSCPNNLNFDSNTLFIDATNNRVGVGTATTVRTLTVAGGIELSSASDQKLAWGISGSYLNWIESGGGPGTTYMRFATGNAEAMRIDASGNVGIGTSSPGAKLDVADASGGAPSIRLTNSAAGAWVRFIGTGGSNTFVDSNAGFTFRTGASYTTAAILDSSGNLGLGVTPSAWNTSFLGCQLGAAAGLMASKVGTGFNALSNAYYAADGTYKYLISNYASVYSQYNGTHSWSVAPSGTAGSAISFTQAMTLTAAGDLGIGTASPSSRLHVYSVSQANGSGGVITRVRNNFYTGYTSKDISAVTDVLRLSGFYTADGGSAATVRLHLSGIRTGYNYYASIYEFEILTNSGVGPSVTQVRQVGQTGVSASASGTAVTFSVSNSSYTSFSMFVEVTIINTRNASTEYAIVPEFL